MGEISKLNCHTLFAFVSVADVADDSGHGGGLPEVPRDQPGQGHAQLHTSSPPASTQPPLPRAARSASPLT